MRTVAVCKNSYGVKIHAYCLMPNHVHFLLQIPEVPISIFMQKILTSFAVLFNQKYERWGHVFQGRFKSLQCSDDIYYKTLLRYIHRNPVRAGLVSEPSAWPWTSHRDILSRDDSFVEATRALSVFSLDIGQAKEAYLQFLGEDSRQSDLAVSRLLFESEEELKEFDQSSSLYAHSLLEKIHEEIGVLANACDTVMLANWRERFVTRSREAGFSFSEIARYLNISKAGAWRAGKRVNAGV